jgi:hypothetical protein
MLVISNPQLFAETVEAAKRATGGDARWCAAIDRAVEEITEHPERFAWMDDHMLIHSPTSDEVYEAGGKRGCACVAFDFHKPCKHRCAYRIWKLYLESVGCASERAKLPASGKEALLQNVTRPAERVGHHRI